MLAKLPLKIDTLPSPVVAAGTVSEPVDCTIFSGGLVGIGVLSDIVRPAFDGAAERGARREMPCNPSLI